MNKILTTMAALSAIAIAAPAAAQSNGYPNASGNQTYQNGAYADSTIGARIQQLRIRVQSGVRSGSITRREAAQLNRQLRQLSNLERQYSRNGLSQQERADLLQRVRNVRQQIRQADGGDQSRWGDNGGEDGDGQYEGSWGRNGQYGQGGQQGRIDRNNDGYDDRDYDRDGRWEDDVNPGGYQEPAHSGGIGGLIQDVLGVGGLRVGQRASANLGAVPYEYQDRFRDGNGSYFRSDGRQIYEIDARTQTVMRVYPITR